MWGLCVALAAHDPGLDGALGVAWARARHQPWLALMAGLVGLQVPWVAALAVCQLYQVRWLRMPVKLSV